MYRVTPIICRSRNTLGTGQYDKLLNHDKIPNASPTLGPKLESLCARNFTGYLTPLPKQQCKHCYLATRCRPFDARVANFTLSTPLSRYPYPPQERVKCPPPDPLPPPPPPEWRVKFGLFVIAVLTGYFTVHAKKSPEFRDWLSIHAPWFDDFVAIAYQENMTHREFLEKCVSDFRDYLEQRTRPRTCSIDGAPASSCDPTAEDKPPKQKERIECPEEPKVTNKGGKVCDIPTPPVITTDICELEECLRDRGDTAYFGYMTARDACKVYNDLANKTMVDFSYQAFTELEPAMEERQELVKEHAADADEAWANLNDLQKYFECGGMKASKEQLENTKLLFNEFQAKIKNMQAEYIWEDDRSVAFENRCAQVKAILDAFIEDNQGLFPSVDYTSPKPHITDDVDLFLIHSLKYTKKLRAILDDMAINMSSRADRGIESLPPPKDDKEKKARAYELRALHKKLKADLDKSYGQRLDELKAHNDKVLKDSLKMQADRHEELMKIKIDEKEAEATENLNKLVKEAVAAQKAIFDAELAEMAAKLKVVETKLEERLKAEREVRRAAELYAAGSSLLAATKKGEPRIKIDKELKALEKAAGNDTLVHTVLKSIPEDVRKNGFVPESILKERYHSMEDVALRVALVEQEGAPLPVYVMSYIQSWLLFMKLNGIPQEDVDNPIREKMDDLDTFDMLQRARYWMQQGNMAAALRYVGSLEGASRAAAATWHDDAKSHLEIRQAAQAVIAHANALSLQYV